jgi:MFS family permease
MLGQGFFNTYVSIRLSIDGYSSGMIGIVNSCYFLGMMLGSLYIERFIRRIGHIRAFAIFASINAAAIITQSFILTIPTWMFFRFVVGVCAAGLFVVIESWLLLLSTIKTRGKLLSLYMVAIYAAQGAGQFILNLMPLDSHIPFATSVLLSSLSVIPVCVMRSGAPQHSEDASMMTIFHVAKKCPFGILGCLIAGMVLSAFYSLGPVFARKTLDSVMQVSSLMGYTILGGLVLQWPIGHLSDIFDRLKVLLAVAAILICITITLFFTLPYPYLIAVAILFGGFSFTLYPLSITFTSDHFHSSKIVSITCSLYVVYGLGSIIGPLLSPLVMNYTRPSGLFLYDAILVVLLVIVGLSNLSKKREKIEEDQQGEYIPLPRTTPLAFYLDPRQDDAEDDAVEEFIFHTKQKD